jgi:hypothetical protein
MHLYELVGDAKLKAVILSPSPFDNMTVLQIQENRQARRAGDP